MKRIKIEDLLKFNPCWYGLVIWKQNEFDKIDFDTISIVDIPSTIDDRSDIVDAFTWVAKKFKLDLCINILSSIDSLLNESYTYKKGKLFQETFSISYASNPNVVYEMHTYMYDNKEREIEFRTTSFSKTLKKLDETILFTSYHKNGLLKEVKRDDGIIRYSEIDNQGNLILHGEEYSSYMPIYHLTKTKITKDDEVLEKTCSMQKNKNKLVIE